MSKYDWNFNLPDWNFTLPESVFKTQEILNGLAASALAMSDAWKAAIPHYDFSGAYAALTAYLDNYESISKQASQMSSLAKSVLPLIDTSVFDTIRETTAAAKALQDVDWGWVVNAYAEAFGDRDGGEQESLENIAEESLTPEIRAEMAADITQVLSEPESMHITSRNKYLEWIKKSPEHALQFLGMLIALIGLFLQALSVGLQVREACLTKDSHVYEQPSSTSSVVYNLTIENNVTVIGDEPYYYEIEFVNPETGEVVTGYVYKGNVTVEEPEETVTQEEAEDTAEGEATEESEAIPDATANPTEPTD